jgi:serine/threonine protein kinase
MAALPAAGGAGGAGILAKYIKQEKAVGEGTYGVVYKAREKATGESVALKKIRLEVSGARAQSGMGAVPVLPARFGCYEARVQAVAAAFDECMQQGAVCGADVQRACSSMPPRRSTSAAELTRLHPPPSPAAHAQVEDEGVPSTALREISLLKELDHPNVVK